MIDTMGKSGVLNIPTSINTVPTTAQATLFLVSPRDFSSHFTRPLNYNFNINTIQTVAEEMSAGGAHINSNAMARNPAFLGSILPSTSGFNVNTQSFSEYWTFMLILATGQSNIVGNLNTNKSIAIGICSEEPISPLGMESATPEQFLNPNCQLVITKMLGYKNSSSVHASGVKDRVHNVIDSNIIHSLPDMFATGNTDQSLYNISAENVSNNVDIISDPTELGDATTVLPRVEDSIQNLSKDYLDTVQEVPQNHLNTILSHMQGAVQSDEMNRLSNTHWNDNANYPGSQGSFETNLVSDFSEGKYAFDHIMSSATPIAKEPNLTIGSIQANYGLKVSPFKVPAGMTGDVIPQEEGSVHNIASALITNAMPAILNEFGISVLAFDYESVNGNRQITGASSIHAECDQDQLVHKSTAALTSIERKIFQTVYELGGHFELSARCSLTGFTTCRLNFFDYDDNIVDAVYREETMLGGMISPIVGTTAHLTNNAVQLNNLTRNVAEVIYHKNGQY